VTRWVKRLLIAHIVGYVTWLILARWSGLTDVAREMVLVPGAVLEGHAWQLASHVVSCENPLAFLFDLLALWMFGSPLESRWGARRFLLYYFGLAVASAGLVTLLALGVTRLAAQPHLGPGASILGLVVAWGILYAEQPVYFFGLLPLKGKHLLLIVVGSIGLYALATSPIAFVQSALGMILAALYTLGWLRPAQIAGSLRSAWLRWRARRARRHLRSIEEDDERRYLH
jgi:membrane associated rhomboid family serine protease